MLLWLQGSLSWKISFITYQAFPGYLIARTEAKDLVHTAVRFGFGGGGFLLPGESVGPGDGGVLVCVPTDLDDLRLPVSDPQAGCVCIPSDAVFVAVGLRLGAGKQQHVYTGHTVLRRDSRGGEPPDRGGDFHDTIQRTERELLARALQETEGNRSAAVRTLGMKLSTFRDKLTKHGLD